GPRLCSSRPGVRLLDGPAAKAPGLRAEPAGQPRRRRLDVHAQCPMDATSRLVRRLLCSLTDTSSLGYEGAVSRGRLVPAGAHRAGLAGDFLVGAGLLALSADRARPWRARAHQHSGERPLLSADP